jgi:hypothetical protein
MRFSKKQIARKINQLVKIKQKINALADREAMLVLAIKHAGGGESASYCADLVKVKAHWVHVGAHKRLVLSQKD